MNLQVRWILHWIPSDGTTECKSYQHLALCSKSNRSKKLLVMLQKFASWGTGFLRQLAGSNILLCRHRLSGLVSKGWASRTKDLTLYTLASRLQKQKARSNPYMVIFNFIGYFTLVLCDFPLLGTMWPSSCSDFSGFISLLCHSYFPATFSGLRPRLFSSDPPPCYIIPPLMLGPT
jgi:hypothetical protein